MFSCTVHTSGPKYSQRIFSSYVYWGGENVRISMARFQAEQKYCDGTTWCLNNNRSEELTRINYSTGRDETPSRQLTQNTSY